MKKQGLGGVFVSYAADDRAWAEWLAWVLEEAGYPVLPLEPTFGSGQSCGLEPAAVLERAERAVAVLSRSYLRSEPCAREWSEVLAKAAREGEEKLVVVSVAPDQRSGAIGPSAPLELYDASEREARERLLARFGGSRSRPVGPSALAGSSVRSTPRRPPFPSTIPPIWNIPHRNPCFTGREAELRDLRDAFTGGAPTIGGNTRAITGCSGVGKTQLAIEYAYRFKEDFPLIWWVRAADALTLAADYGALAQARDLPEKGEIDPSKLVAAVRAWLGRNTGWLLIFDDARDPDGLEAFLPEGAGGQVIVTCESSGRAFGSPLALDAWRGEEGGEFLLRRTGEADRDAADRLALALGNLPLALELAAAYAGQARVTLTECADALEDRGGDWLPGEPRDPGGAVAEAWKLSYGRLEKESPAGAGLLGVCAFLAPDAIPLELMHTGADHLTGPLQSAASHPLRYGDAVTALVRYSLAREEGETLFIHRLVQAVTRDRLPERQRKAFAACAARLVSAALPVFPHGTYDGRIAETYDRLLPHARVAARHAEEAGVAIPEAARLWGLDGLYQAMRGDLRAARAAYEQALALGERAFGCDHPNVAIRANNLGSVLLDQGDLAVAKEAYERALAIDERAFGPDHPEVATDFNNLGGVLQVLGDLAGAEASYRRALAIDESTLGARHPHVAIRANNLGVVLMAQGDFSGAKAAFERAVSIFAGCLPEGHPFLKTVRKNARALSH